MTEGNLQHIQNLCLVVFVSLSCESVGCHWWACSPQRREERTRAGAAGPEEGGDPLYPFSRRHRPRRPGEHALAGLLPGQEQADEGPALWRVSHTDLGSDLISGGKKNTMALIWRKIMDHIIDSQAFIILLSTEKLIKILLFRIKKVVFKIRGPNLYYSIFFYYFPYLFYLFLILLVVSLYLMDL